MKNAYPYSDELVSEREYMVAIPAFTIGVSILSLPRILATHTYAFDGWMPLLSAGLFFMACGWLAARLVQKFPGMTFHEYGSRLVTRPISAVLTFVMGVTFASLVAYEVRVLSMISKLYLFDRTPIEAIALVFLLVVIYAVAGSRAALFRINTLFLPIVLLFTLIVQLANLKYLDIGEIKPFFQTPAPSLLKAAFFSSGAFVGYIILLQYASSVRNPTHLPKHTLVGMAVPVVLYLIIYFFVVSTFGQGALRNIAFPTIETAKEVELPGGFFERFESIYFTVWTMTIFSTAAMAYDLAILSLSSVFKRVSKMRWIYILSPLIMLLAMVPNNNMEVEQWGTIYIVIGIIYGVIVPIMYLIMARLRKAGAGSSRQGC
ncbi:spore gernimation protein [Xylanibacillus composti]|uniref:Germination protein GerLB n=1 Tax=Xylanibacillus composti TaxID=1572762 RepID=A0A8J4M151_9BACL|nr:endospore germination permease [Xylanibacillus composti]MDT9724914.1 spore gernimation protein [Xylanibacillus composti]GIQ68149.1 germination protein GerLB [Xylanibacillus composti]